MDELILYFSLKYKGDFNAIYKALVNQEPIDESERNMLKKKLEASGCNYMTLLSNNYPDSLKLINCPPFVLYYYGDITLLNEKTISLIGTAQPDLLGSNATKCIVQELLQNNFVTVSGLDEGMSTLIHEEVMRNNGRTIAVVSGGIEYNPIKDNSELYNYLKNEQLIISEYPGKILPTTRQLNIKNRLITAFSDALITETREEQECLSAQSFAFEQGKDIFFIPSNFDCFINGNINPLLSVAKIYTGLESLYSEDLYLGEERALEEDWEME